MKRILDKMITETIRLDECKEGDKIYISSSSINNRSFSINRKSHKFINGVLKKIKLLPHGKAQIKYVGYSKTDTIQKIDLDASTPTERTRKATKADGVNAGEIVRETAEQDGIKYIDVSGEGNLEKRLNSATPVVYPNTHEIRTQAEIVKIVTGTNPLEVSRIMGLMMASAIGLSGGIVLPVDKDKTSPRDISGLWSEPHLRLE